MNKCPMESRQAIALLVLGASMACLAVAAPSRAVPARQATGALDELLDIDDEPQERPLNLRRTDDNKDDHLYQVAPSRHHQQALASANNNNDDDDDEAELDTDGDLTSASDLNQQMLADYQQQQQMQQMQMHPDHLHGLDTNIENAKLELSALDMQPAAGHHHHHKHHVHGKMEMGAHTSKKGAFGWHAKFPVGGKGR